MGRSETTSTDDGGGGRRKAGNGDGGGRWSSRELQRCGEEKETKKALEISRKKYPLLFYRIIRVKSGLLGQRVTRLGMMPTWTWEIAFGSLVIGLKKSFSFQVFYKL